MFCTNCGKDLPHDSKICPNCGFDLEIPKETYIKMDEHSGNLTLSETSLNNPSENKYNKPITTTQFFLTQILFMVPIVNLFFIFFWSLKKNVNKNLKAYSRSVLIWLSIASVLIIFALLTFAFMQNLLPVNI